MIDKILCPSVDVSSVLKEEIQRSTGNFGGIDDSNIIHIAEDYCKTRLFEKVKKIWITGSPSMGKSKSLEIFKISLIKYHIIYTAFDLKEFNKFNKDTKDAYSNKIKNLGKALSNPNIDVVMLDSYDELDDSKIEGVSKKETIKKLIENTPKSIIIASRSNPETENLFEKYQKIHLKEFSEFKIRAILQKKIGTASVNSRLFEIINNTMILIMFIELWKGCVTDEERKQLLDAPNTGMIIFQYLKKVFFVKNGIVSVADAASNDLKNQTENFHTKLYKIGECFRDCEKSIQIDRAFNEIFFLQEGSLQSIHHEYVDFVCGYYIAKKINDGNKDQEAEKTLKITFNSFDQRRMLLYAGQCLQFLSKEPAYMEFKPGEEIFRELNTSFPKKSSKEYAWLVHIWSSFRNNILDNDEYFQVGNQQLKYILKKHSFFKPTTIKLHVCPNWIRFYDVWVPERNLLISATETSRIKDFLPFEKTNNLDKKFFKLQKNERRISNAIDWLKFLSLCIPFIILLIAFVFALLHYLNVISPPYFMQGIIQKIAGLFYDLEKSNEIMLANLGDVAIYSTYVILCMIVLMLAYTILATLPLECLILLTFLTVLAIYFINCYKLKNVVGQLESELKAEFLYNCLFEQNELKKLGSSSIHIAYEKATPFGFSNSLVFDLSLNNNQFYKDAYISIFFDIILDAIETDAKKTHAPSKEHAIMICTETMEQHKRLGNTIKFLLYNSAYEILSQISSGEYLTLYQQLKNN